MIAIALEIVKALLLLLFVALAETTNESLNGTLVMVLWVLILPEMMVSYEQGPHGVLARIVMFSAGTLVNFILVSIVVLIWQSKSKDVAS